MIKKKLIDFHKFPLTFLISLCFECHQSCVATVTMLPFLYSGKLAPYVNQLMPLLHSLNYELLLLILYYFLKKKDCFLCRACLITNSDVN